MFFREHSLRHLASEKPGDLLIPGTAARPSARIGRNTGHTALRGPYSDSEFRHSLLAQDTARPGRCQEGAPLTAGRNIGAHLGQHQDEPFCRF